MQGIQVWHHFFKGRSLVMSMMDKAKAKQVDTQERLRFFWYFRSSSSTHELNHVLKQQVGKFLTTKADYDTALEQKLCELAMWRERVRLCKAWNKLLTMYYLAKKRFPDRVHKNIASYSPAGSSYHALRIVAPKFRPLPPKPKSIRRAH